jgi:hypothetical protein
VKIGDGDGKSLIMAPQFYVFWAVSVPVTLLVLVMWILWSQREEIATFVAGWWPSKKQNSDSDKEA